jgi:hypothetical protein
MVSKLTILSTTVSKVDWTLDFQNFHSTTVDFSKKSLSTVDLRPKVDCRLEGLLYVCSLQSGVVCYLSTFCNTVSFTTYIFYSERWFICAVVGAYARWPSCCVCSLVTSEAVLVTPEAHTINQTLLLLKFPIINTAYCLHLVDGHNWIPL